MNGLTDFIGKLGPMRLAALAAVMIGLFAFFIFFTERMTRQDMAVLFGDLDPSDASQITEQLTAQDIPFELSADGTRVFVPRKDAARLRMSMAEAGLPSGGSVGYEIFDQSGGFTATSFEQQIRQLRALEGELARSIRSIDAVRAARVHLVLPKRELFSRETNEPTASIVLSLHGIGELSSGRVTAIQHLVAAAVPRLSPFRVSVIDAAGNLLAKGTEDPNTGDAMSAQDTADMQGQHESRLGRAIERLLERSVGYGRVLAEVTADMDFDRITTNQETFDPEGQVLRSLQTISEEEKNSEGAGGSGVVSVDTNLPDGSNGTGGGRDGEQSSAVRTEETANYEISKTIQTHIRETGIIRRLSVAVMVDGHYDKGEDGGWIYTERSADELAKLNDLVRSAVGYDEARGDRVSVVNMRFARPQEEPTAEIETGFLGLDKADYFRAAEMGVLAIVALLTLLLVVRPALNRIFEGMNSNDEANDAALLEAAQAQLALVGPDGEPMEGGRAEAVALSSEDQQLIDMDQVEGRIRESSLNRVTEIVDQHTEQAVGIVRSWLYQEQTN